MIKLLRKGGIKTYYEKGEPRLLLIAADVETATTGVFDTYNYNNNVWMTIIILSQ